jgi:hypothetical protein
MHARRRAGTALVLTALLVGGCSNRARFSYPNAPGGLASQGALVGALHDVCDRLTDREIGDFYEDTIPVAITNAVKSEMEAAGVFSRVESLAACSPIPSLEELRERKIAIVVNPQVDRLQWVVPDYAQINATAFAVSLLFGLVGGVIYGMTDTEVYGHVELRMILFDVRTGQSLDRVYSGEAREEMDKLACDTPETRRKMVGRAFNEAMKGFRGDLKAMAADVPSQ